MNNPLQKIASPISWLSQLAICFFLQPLASRAPLWASWVLPLHPFSVQGTYFGSNSRLSAGLHQAFNYYLSCCLPMQYFLFFNIKFTKSIFKIRADLHIIKDLKAIAEDFQSFWPPGRESASKYICRFAGFLKVC